MDTHCSFEKSYLYGEVIGMMPFDFASDIEAEKGYFALKTSKNCTEEIIIHNKPSGRQINLYYEGNIILPSIKLDYPAPINIKANNIYLVGSNYTNVTKLSLNMPTDRAFIGGNLNVKEAFIDVYDLRIVGVINNPNTENIVDISVGHILYIKGKIYGKGKVESHDRSVTLSENAVLSVASIDLNVSIIRNFGVIEASDSFRLIVDNVETNITNNRTNTTANNLGHIIAPTDSLVKLHAANFNLDSYSCKSLVLQQLEVDVKDGKFYNACLIQVQDLIVYSDSAEFAGSYDANGVVQSESIYIATKKYNMGYSGKIITNTFWLEDKELDTRTLEINNIDNITVNTVVIKSKVLKLTSPSNTKINNFLADTKDDYIIETTDLSWCKNFYIYTPGILQLSPKFDIKSNFFASAKHISVQSDLKVNGTVEITAESLSLRSNIGTLVVERTISAIGNIVLDLGLIEGRFIGKEMWPDTWLYTRHKIVSSEGAIYINVDKDLIEAPYLSGKHGIIINGDRNKSLGVSKITNGGPFNEPVEGKAVPILKCLYNDAPLKSQRMITKLQNLMLPSNSK